MQWPGIIRHGGDAELLYVGDQSEWDSSPELRSGDYDESDYLVDSAGNVFAFTRGDDNRVDLEPTGAAKTLHEILGLVKAHAAQSGSCCVAKLYARSIGEAFEIVRSTL